jgi:transcriptional regulator with XRE-family HTH domain
MLAFVTVQFMIDASDFSNRLRELREAASLSKIELALKLDVSEDTIGRLEDPRTVIPSKYIPALAQLLETTADHLMGWDRIPAGASGEVA